MILAVQHTRLVLLFLLAAVIPAFFIHRWLMRLIKPRQSAQRLLLFLLAVLLFAVVYGMLVVWLLIQYDRIA